jgi:biopolymer transport protein ExbB
MKALLEYWEAGGPLMIPLALLCLAMWYWLLTLGWRLRKERASALGLQELLHGSRVNRMAQEIQRWAQSHPGPVARVAQFALGGERAPERIRGRCAEAKLAEVPRFEHELEILKAMVAAAPLLGLLGTVRGMISTFFVLSLRGSSSTELLSGGISEALLTTQVGLIVALPGFIGAYIIARRIRGLGVALDILESHLIDVATLPSHAGKGGAP